MPSCLHTPRAVRATLRAASPRPPRQRAGQAATRHRARRAQRLTAGEEPRYRVQYSASSELDSTVSRNSQSVTSALPVSSRICSWHHRRKGPARGRAVGRAYADGTQLPQHVGGARRQPLQRGLNWQANSVEPCQHCTAACLAGGSGRSPTCQRGVAAFSHGLCYGDGIGGVQVLACCGGGRWRGACRCRRRGTQTLC